MPGCRQVLPLLVCLLVECAAAQDWSGASRDIARRIAAVVEREPAALAVRNASSLAAPDFAALRGAVESELRARGVRIASDLSSTSIQLTVSENTRGYLLVAEVRRGDTRGVLVAEWPRPAPGAAPSAALSLEKRLIWEQEDPILDFALLEDAGERRLMVLDAARVTLYVRAAAGWEQRHAWPLDMPGPWPRDPRGRVMAQPGGAFQAYLPGTVCRGTVNPPAMECKPGESLWPIMSGATLAGHAAFRPGRNYFEGALIPASGAKAAVPPFFSAALAGTAQNPLWIFARPDGRAAVHDVSLAPAGQPIAGWGDIAGTEAACGSGRQVLVTRPSGGDEDDAVQAWEFAGAAAAPVSQPLDFSGPVTALWPSGGASAAAVVRDPHTGRYAAYSLAIGCGF